MVNESESAAIHAAAQAVKQTEVKIPDRLTLSNGIVLKLKALPPLLLASIENTIPEPEVPVVFIEEKQRNEPNPNHPDYLKAVQKRDTEITMATINLTLYACTEIESIPDNCVGPADDSWIRVAKMAGLDFNPEDEVERYLAWLRSYALRTIDDMNKAQTIPVLMAGISDFEVDNIVNSFRGLQGRGTDTDVPAANAGENGDNVLNANRRARRAARRT